ncbi:MAG: family 1 glycosylhydrolase [Hyphomonadaceae bacterium]|nr:family 1 glycosylhydrolase [Hyphomonadaceae bacterium]
MRAFPPGFVWGAATAAHQVEGANTASDCWALEHARPSVFAEPSGDAIDQFHRYGDDLALLAALGLNSYRFSIEWARIEPEEGFFSQAALDHYKRLIDACWARGLAPCATFHHFTSPRWMAKQGGWTSPKIADAFGRFCEIAADELAEDLAFACTINEINIPAFVRASRMAPDFSDAHRKAAMDALGAPPESFYMFAGTDGYAERAVAAHRRARDAIKAAAPNLPVGMTISIQEEEAEDHDDARTALAQRRAAIYDPFYEAAKGDDFVGVQTYTRMMTFRDGRTGRPKGAEKTAMGYEFRPQALAAACRDAAHATGCPVLVTESGYAGEDGRRCTFIQGALDGVHAAIADGVDIRGYYYWSAFDNFEWMSGYGPRFGMIGVDRRSQKRLVKPSAAMLGAIAHANALDVEDGETVVMDETGAPLGLGGRR